MVVVANWCTIDPIWSNPCARPSCKRCNARRPRPCPLSTYPRLLRTPCPPINSFISPCRLMTWSFSYFVDCGNAALRPASPGPTLVLSFPSILSVRGFRVDTLEFWPASHGQLSVAGSRTLDFSYSFAYKTSLMTRGCRLMYVLRNCGAMSQHNNVGEQRYALSVNWNLTN